MLPNGAESSNILYRCMVLQWLKEIGNSHNFQEPEYLIRYSDVLGLDCHDSIPGRNKRFFFFPTASRPGSGAHPASYPMGTWVKYEVEHSV
jgi:hypothetical protein